MLAFFHGGQGGAPNSSSLPPSKTFAPPEIWSENNWKISITIDFAPPEKILEDSQQVLMVGKSQSPHTHAVTDDILHSYYILTITVMRLSITAHLRVSLVGRLGDFQKTLAKIIAYCSWTIAFLLEIFPTIQPPMENPASLPLLKMRPTVTDEVLTITEDVHHH